MADTLRSGQSGGDFLRKVRVETTARAFRWGAPEWVAVSAIPAVFLTDWIVTSVSANTGIRGVIDTVIRMLLFAVLIAANRGLLIRHWRAFWSAPWRSVLLVAGGAVLLQVVVALMSAILQPFAGKSHGGGPDATNLALGVALFVSLGPIVTALIEDFVFRHTLMLSLPLWGTKLRAVVVTVVNALLFGALHINNFDGHWLLTLTFAGAGLVMNVIYLWTRNIWHVLLMHALNNFVLAGPLAVLLVHGLSRS